LHSFFRFYPLGFDLVSASLNLAQEQTRVILRVFDEKKP
jgi:hypothetical protein